MEIATMPYVADVAPPAVPRAQGRESGGGQGKSADSFAGLMAGVLGEGTGQAGPAAEPTTKTADQSAQADQSATGMAALTTQIPANLLALMAQQAPTTNAAAMTVNVQAAVSGVQAVGAATATAAGPMAQQALPTTATGQMEQDGPLSGNAGQQSILPATALKAAVQGTQPAADSQNSAAAAALQAPTAVVTAGPPVVLQPAQPQTQPLAGQQLGQQPAVTVQPQVTQTAGAGKSQVQMPGGQYQPVQVAATNAQSEQPAATDSGQQTATTAAAQTTTPTTAITEQASDKGDGQAATGGSDQDQPATAQSEQPASALAAVVEHKPTVSHTAATPTENAPPAPANDPNNIAGQIVDHARLITKQESSEMVIKLKPEHLGEVTLRISVAESGAVSASFHAANPEVRGAIEATLTQLRQDLSNQGLKVDNVGIYASLDQFFRGDQQQTPQQQPQFKASTRRSKEDEVFTEAVAAMSPQIQLSGSGGIDYRI